MEYVRALRYIDEIAQPSNEGWAIFMVAKGMKNRFIDGEKYFVMKFDI